MKNYIKNYIIIIYKFLKVLNIFLLMDKNALLKTNINKNNKNIIYISCNKYLKSMLKHYPINSFYINSSNRRSKRTVLTQLL